MYFLVLIIIARITGRKADNASFFNANRKSPWFVVAFGMIGASLSGVTFISIPGVVGGSGTNMAFSYMQMVLGYLVGYLIIATVLMPIYYRLSVSSIYGYLGDRFGPTSYKVGSAYFILSRVIGASFRLFLVAMILDKFVLAPMGVPFFMTVIITIILIWSYTFKGGIKTIVWTDTLQTTFMLLAVVATIFSICSAMNIGLSEMGTMIQSKNYGQWFFFEDGWNDPNNFFKQFISGALIALVMTGLDQDMMQKNLSCKTLGDAQKNIFAFSIILIFANILFLSLGAMLFIYADFINMPIPEATDTLYPEIALNHLSPAIGIVFILGLIAAAYSSADSALTALTTAFCIDFLGFERKEISEENKKNTRTQVHIAFSVLLFLVIMIFNSISDDSVINDLFKAAGYTYGPILGLFSFGIFTRRVIKDHLVIPIAIAAPIIAYVINKYSDVIFVGFKFGFLIIALNGLLTFIGLWLISSHAYKHNDALDG